MSLVMDSGYKSGAGEEQVHAQAGKHTDQPKLQLSRRWMRSPVVASWADL